MTGPRISTHLAVMDILQNPRHCQEVDYSSGRCMTHPATRGAGFDVGFLHDEVGREGGGELCFSGVYPTAGLGLCLSPGSKPHPLLRCCPTLEPPRTSSRAPTRNQSRAPRLASPRTHTSHFGRHKARGQGTTHKALGTRNM